MLRVTYKRSSVPEAEAEQIEVPTFKEAVFILTVKTNVEESIFYEVVDIERTTDFPTQYLMSFTRFLASNYGEKKARQLIDAYIVHLNHKSEEQTLKAVCTGSDMEEIDYISILSYFKCFECDDKIQLIEALNKSIVLGSLVGGVIEDTLQNEENSDMENKQEEETNIIGDSNENTSYH